MLCNHCGTSFESGNFCPNCGAPVAGNQEQGQSYDPNAQQNGYQQPGFDPNNGYQQPYAYDITPPLSMGWFKFLINFAIFAGAVLNVISGISLLTGSVYGEDAALVYEVFDNLKMIDVIFVVLLIALAAFGVFTRFRLSGYYKNGPLMLIALYAFVIVADLGYMIALYAVLPEMVTNELDLSSTISSAVTSVAMIVINFSYFKKRSHLFTR
jgi:hypothetical protein